MTLRPNPSVAVNLAPLTEPAAERGISPRVLIGLAGNVVVFVPLGAALALAMGGEPAGRRLLLATLAGAGLSFGIELAQMALPSRVTAVDDLMLNTVGTVVGALVGIELRNQVLSLRLKKKPGFLSLNKGDSNDRFNH